AAGGAMRITGSGRSLGTDVTRTLLFDGRGRFIDSLDGPLAQVGGFDGTDAWGSDWTGTSRKLVLGDAAGVVVEHALLTGSWCLSGAPFTFTLADAAPEGTRVLAWKHADGVLEGTLTLDAGTHLVRTATRGSGDQASSWTFQDYATTEGFSFPTRIEALEQGMPQRFEVRARERLATADNALFAAQVTLPSDTRYRTDVAPALEVKRVASGHLLVHPTVDGEDLGWFIFDSGAGTNCIALSVTDALAGEPFGQIGAKGVGGTVPSQFWRAEELALGPVVVANPTFMGLDLAFLERAFGVEIGGILGYEFFSRCVVELDMQGATIALHDPARYELPAAGRWDEVLIYARHPCVRAGFEDHEGLFKIDTGAAGDTVTMHYDAVRELELLAGRETKVSGAGGVGGTVVTRTGELASFRLGGHAFEAIQASFATEKKGAFADAYVQGNIGGKLLAPFVLVFDYPHERLGFVPR
ncbi:MAG: aspartyl protease family protein, partial [Planctomycetota bacterium]